MTWLLRRALAGVVLVLGTTSGGAALGYQGRYALLVGANRGEPGEPVLRYAAQDAERLREVLVDLGSFLPEDVVVLNEPSADRLRVALARLNARIRAEADRAPSSLLLVFYSGHADGEFLHLGPTRLPWAELRDLAAGSAAAARLLVVDACRSGQATRVKGTRLDDVPFALEGVAGEPAEGFAILSSATAGESAQESDELKSSFFSQHLVAALQGAADQSGDGQVTLSEAFAYASARTVESTATTWAGIQHPTYAWDLKGRGELVLTRPALARGYSSVLLSAPGQYLFRADSGAGVLAAAASAGSKPRLLRVRPGRYLLQRRLPHQLFEGRVALEPERTVDVAGLPLRAVELDQLVRKGGPASPSRGLLLGGAAASPPFGELPWTVGPMLTASVDAPALSIDFHLGTGFGTVANENLTTHLRALCALAGGRRVVDVAAASLSAGLRLGGCYYQERYDTARLAPRRWQLAPSADMVARVDWRFPRGLFVAAEAGVRTALLRVQTESGATQTQAAAQLLSSAGAGLRW